MADIKGLQTGEDQLVTFSLANEEFAFPIGIVQEIVRPPDITKVPNAPSYIEGIANLRGNILPIVNLRNRLVMSDKEIDESSRIVVINAGGSMIGGIVDSVSEVIHIETKIIDPPPEVVGSVDGQNLLGVAKINDGKRLIMILSSEKIIPDLVETAGTVAAGAAAAEANHSTSERKEAKSVADEEELLVTFRLGDEEFAIDIMHVQEIIRVSEITSVPRAPGFVKGVISLRNRLLPIIDLRTKFGMLDLKDPSDKTDPSSGKSDTDTIDARRIIVMDLDGVLTGIQVDSVSEVLRMERKNIEAPPTILSTEEASRLKGVGKLDDGKRLLMLLDVRTLVTIAEKNALKQAAGVDAAEGRKTKGAAMEITDEKQFVCFQINSEDYSINIMQVQEIIRVEEITVVPRAPVFVEGVVNLRGDILPVIDMRTRFNLAKAERADHNRIIVADISGKRTGFIVDSVSEVLRIPVKQIEVAPDVVADEGRGQFIEGIGKLDDGKRIIIVVNVDSLLTAQESAEMTGFNGRKSASGKVEKIDGAEAPAPVDGSCDLSQFGKGELMEIAMKRGLKTNTKMNVAELRKLIADAG